MLTAGAWIGSLLGGFNFPFRVERQVLFWFEPSGRGEDFLPERCPVYIFEHEPGRYFYGFPNLGRGVKVAAHHQGETADPDRLRRQVDLAEVQTMRRLVDTFLPAAAGPLLATEVCLYTNTPDEHFFIDWHPANPSVLIASPCSGHGFKFSAAIGEVIADLLTRGQSRFDLRLFRIR